MKPYFSRKSELGLFSGCVVWGERVVIPEKLRNRILNDLHEGHLGMVKMKGLARSYVWWPGIDKDIEMIAKKCSGCQEIQKNPSKAPLHPWEFPSSPWRRIHVDFAGPFQDNMFLIVVDAHSKWPEVVPMRKTTTDKTINVLRGMFARWGIPHQLVLDNGPQFTSEQFEMFMKDNNVKHLRGAPYHPSTNGLAERFVQSFKNAMKAAQTKDDLSLRIARFLLAYRNAPHAVTGEAPADLMLGRKLRSRLEMIRPDLRKKVEDNIKPPSKNSETLRMIRMSWYVITCLVQSGYMEQYSVKVVTSYDVLVGSKIWKRHTDQIVETGLTLYTPNEPEEIIRRPDPIPTVPMTPAPPAVTSDNQVKVPSEQVPKSSQNTGTQPAFVVPKMSVSPKRYPVREHKAPRRLIEEY